MRIEYTNALERRLQTALDALHGMVEQYCRTDKTTEEGKPFYNDMSMGATEDALQVLQNEGRITSEQW